MKFNFMIEEGLLKYVEEITDVDYHGELELKDIENIIKDLVAEYHNLQEELESYKKHCEERHVEKKVDLYDYYGVGKEDFV